ncbi:uncharacterized protein L969DRAFT_14614 [Mixia osmundae IAM 14324]|uniref:Uncharacterized protein n=1 Tax=Mixia osmundae (strain CBS 9802 / IAM 14324 / JCM 22182 / KY 12970) TaxID=764103 RepID=G7E2V4_MIXOS|nr:uncharacterized protein L969DRAFT_14614 [Mixia osmundae IAM 14324]KEI42412.1 hypothetical protein L969DRAFT_14614 [Mixia osmundae IAM 14324]GAA97298.1 hypothetical protein E5Q_03976 [Mixia osmundae IAM 14324]
MADKRASASSSQQVTKRARVEDEDASNAQSMIVASDGRSGTKSQQLIRTVQRTSALKAPIMCLEGHAAEVLDVKFNPTGEKLASVSADRTINLWNVYGDCENYGVFRLKSAAVTIEWSPNPSSHLIVCSCADGTLNSFDAVSGERLKRHRAHTGVVNAIDITRGTGLERIVSGGDDGFVRVWLVETKESIEEIDMGYPITAVRWSQDSQQIYIGGIDNDIHVYDLRKSEIAFTLRDHSDTISGLSLSPQGSHLLSSSFDNTCKVWDVRPFAPITNVDDPSQNPRLTRTLYGAPAGHDQYLRKPCWDSTGKRCAIGAADRTVVIWNVASGEVAYKLPGHAGTVTSVDWLPNAPVIASSSTDKKIYLGETDPAK